MKLIMLCLALVPACCSGQCVHHDGDNAIIVPCGASRDITLSDVYDLRIRYHGPDDYRTFTDEEGHHLTTQCAVNAYAEKAAKRTKNTRKERLTDHELKWIVAARDAWDDVFLGGPHTLEEEIMVEYWMNAAKVYVKISHNYDPTDFVQFDRDFIWITPRVGDVAGGAK